MSNSTRGKVHANGKRHMARYAGFREVKDEAGVEFYELVFETHDAETGVVEERMKRYPVDGPPLTAESLRPLIAEAKAFHERQAGNRASGPAALAALIDPQIPVVRAG